MKKRQIQVHCDICHLALVWLKCDYQKLIYKPLNSEDNFRLFLVNCPNFWSLYLITLKYLCPTSLVYWYSGASHLWTTERNTVKLHVKYIIIIWMLNQEACCSTVLWTHHAIGLQKACWTSNNCHAGHLDSHGVFHPVGVAGGRQFGGESED